MLNIEDDINIKGINIKAVKVKTLPKDIKIATFSDNESSELMNSIKNAIENISDWLISNILFNKNIKMIGQVDSDVWEEYNALIENFSRGQISQIDLNFIFYNLKKDYIYLNHLYYKLFKKIPFTNTNREIIEYYDIDYSKLVENNSIIAENEAKVLEECIINDIENDAEILVANISSNKNSEKGEIINNLKEILEKLNFSNIFDEIINGFKEKYININNVYYKIFGVHYISYNHEKIIKYYDIEKNKFNKNV